MREFSPVNKGQFGTVEFRKCTREWLSDLRLDASAMGDWHQRYGFRFVVLGIGWWCNCIRFSSVIQMKFILSSLNLCNSQLHHSKQDSWLAAFNCWAQRSLMQFSFRSLWINFSANRLLTDSYFSCNLPCCLVSLLSWLGARTTRLTVKTLQIQSPELRCCSAVFVNHNFFKFYKVVQRRCMG